MWELAPVVAKGLEVDPVEMVENKSRFCMAVSRVVKAMTPAAYL